MRIAPSSVRRRPASLRTRSFTGSSSAAVEARSNRSCTAEATLLTFCPPGPDERTNENARSPAGMTRPGAMRMDMAGGRIGPGAAVAASRPLVAQVSCIRLVRSSVQVRDQLALEASDLILEEDRKSTRL